MKITGQRLAVLSCFKDGDIAVSHHDIQTTVASGMDRVSLYRILDLFTQNMIVFKLAELLKQYHVQPQLLFNGNCDKCSHD